MPESVKPARGNYLVKRLSSEKVTPGGIHLPDNAQKKSTRAEILSVGPGGYNEETGLTRHPEYKEGEIVILSQWCGNELTLDGEDLLLIKESEILAVLVQIEARKGAAPDRARR